MWPAEGRERERRAVAGLAGLRCWLLPPRGLEQRRAHTKPGVNGSARAEAGRSAMGTP